MAETTPVVVMMLAPTKMTCIFLIDLDDGSGDGDGGSSSCLDDARE